MITDPGQYASLTCINSSGDKIWTIMSVLCSLLRAHTSQHQIQRGGHLVLITSLWSLRLEDRLPYDTWLSTAKQLILSASVNSEGSVCDLLDPLWVWEAKGLGRLARLPSSVCRPGHKIWPLAESMVRKNSYWAIEYMGLTLTRFTLTEIPGTESWRLQPYASSTLTSEIVNCGSMDGYISPHLNRQGKCRLLHR